MFSVIDGNWASYGAWTLCKKSCRKSRIRTCTNPPPQNGGDVCAGPSQNEQKCTGDLCGKLQKIQHGSQGHLLIRCNAV